MSFRNWQQPKPNKQTTRLEQKEQEHWARPWRQTHHSKHWICGVSKKIEKDDKLKALNTTNINKQTTALETKEQEHWAKHWRRTQHSKHCIWEVSKKKERKMDELATLPTTTTNKQATKLEQKEQVHWEKHWWPTQHWPSCIFKCEATTNMGKTNSRDGARPLLQTGTRIACDGKSVLRYTLQTNTTLTLLYMRQWSSGQS